MRIDPLTYEEEAQCLHEIQRRWPEFLIVDTYPLEESRFAMESWEFQGNKGVRIIAVFQIGHTTRTIKWFALVMKKTRMQWFSGRYPERYSDVVRYRQSKGIIGPAVKSTETLCKSSDCDGTLIRDDSGKEPLVICALCGDRHQLLMKEKE